MPTTPNLDATTLFLCRHGESQWNLAGRIQGQSPDAPGLTDRGREQARLLAERLRSASIDVLVASDLRRAVETAGFVSRALGLQPAQDARWREIHLGQWEGLTREQVAAGWPGILEAVGRGEDLPRGGGETNADLTARTLAAIADLGRRYPGQTICVISHGGNLRSALNALPGGLNGSDPYSTPIPNTAVIVLRIAGGLAQVIAPPDDSHLDGLQPIVTQENHDEL